MSQTTYWVSPTGLPTNNGTLASPWDFESALDGTHTVPPGSTVKFLPGVYGANASYTVKLAGAPGNKINIEPEDPTAQGSVKIKGQFFTVAPATYLKFTGFEFYNEGANDSIAYPVGFWLQAGDSIHMINNVIHDGALGISDWSAAHRSVAYGNIVYNIGWIETDRTHGHCVYSQNNAGNGIKQYKHNYFHTYWGDQYTGGSLGISFYGKNGGVNEYNLSENHIYASVYIQRDNVNFQTDSIFAYGNIAEAPLVGAGPTSDTTHGFIMGKPNKVDGECWYFNNTMVNVSQRINNAIWDTIYSGGNRHFKTKPWWQNDQGMPVWQLYTEVGTWNDIHQGGGVDEYVIWPNQFEPNRTHLVTMDFDLNGTIDVDLSSFLNVGDFFEIYRVMSYTDIPPDTSAVYSGGLFTFSNLNNDYNDTHSWIIKRTGVAPTAPTADFTASTTSICVGDTVYFTDESDNNPTGWFWAFNGGTPSSSTQQNPTVVYNTPGIYEVELIASNIAGMGVPETRPGFITVLDCSPPVSDFGVSDTTICPSDCVDFTDLSLDASSWTWYFPGSTVPTIGMQHPTNVCYNTTGNFDVILVTTNAYGTDSVTKPSFIEVGACLPPISEFSVSDSSICEGQCVSFNDLTSQVPNDWSWYFIGADVTTSSNQNPTNICYSSPGVYGVSLVASNDHGTDSLYLPNFITVNTAYNQFNTIEVCSSNLPVNIHGIPETNPGIYSQTYTSINGCDSIVNIELVVNNEPVINMPTVVGCDEVYVNGNPYFNTQTVYDTYQTANGCDSLVVTPVIVHHTVTTVINESYCEDDSVLVSGKYYNQIGTYYDTLVHLITGCDSILHINIGLDLNEYIDVDTSICSNHNLVIGATSVTEAGTYYDTIVGGATNGCKLIYVHEVTILPDRNIGAHSPDSIICFGDSAQLFGMAGENYTWLNIDNKEGSGFFVRPLETMTYVVTDSSLCGIPQAEVTIRVLDKPIFYVPNAFSPDGNNNNDFFKVESVGVDEFYMMIYNRWGEKVFETKDIEKGWDGTFKNKVLNVGTYVYHIQAKLQCGEEINQKGEVVILK